MAESGQQPDLYSTRGNFVEELASRLEGAWKQGKPVDFNALLPPLGDPLRPGALIELIKVDMECRWRRGQPVVLDYYIDKYKDLGPHRTLPVGLILEEYRVRQLFGDKPSLELYEQRFPGQFAEFRRMLREQPLPTNKASPAAETAPERPPEKVPLGGLKDRVLKAQGVRPIQRLGAGAFGEVWKAEASGGILKAVKIIFRPIDHEEAKRELESLQLIKSLRHHFLLPTHSFWQEDDRLYILMDLADGTLRDRLKECVQEGKSGIPLIELIKYLRESAEALDYLHSKGVQHRDIKPENILLIDGTVRVADFGLARQEATRRLHSGSGAGTPVYMPPEAWHDKIHANSDQYSLAATYAELRQGRRIYAAEGLPSLMAAHLTGRPKLETLPLAEQKVLLKALAKNPDDRYPSCVAFAEALEQAVAPTLPPGTIKGFMSTAELEALKKGGRMSPRERGLLAAAVVGILVLAGILWSLLGPGELRLDPPQAAQGEPLETVRIPLSFQRNGITDPITVSFTGTDKDLTITEVTSEKSFVEVPIEVQAGAVLGDRELEFRAAAGNRTPVEWKVPFRVVPLRSLPRGGAAATFSPAPGTDIVNIHQRNFYRQIDCRLAQTPELTVRFLFIPWEEKGKRLSFYLMENKVTNQLYEAFARQNPDAVNGSRWRLGARGKHFGSAEGSYARILPGVGITAFVPCQVSMAALQSWMNAEARPERHHTHEDWPNPGDLGVREGSWPVLRVDIQEAHRCAAWLGGWLPSVRQWDKAAGRFEENPREGPFEGDSLEFGIDDVAVRRDGELDEKTKTPRPLGPLPVGKALRDKSIFGCRDMAGNGREWTRTIRDDGVTREFLGDPSAISLLGRAVLRGRQFTHPDPLLFADLDTRPSDLQFWRDSRDPGEENQIGFRVSLSILE